jgi:hypothetical protein
MSTLSLTINNVYYDGAGRTLQVLPQRIITHGIPHHFVTPQSGIPCTTPGYTQYICNYMFSIISYEKAPRHFQHPSVPIQLLNPNVTPNIPLTPLVIQTGNGNIVQTNYYSLNQPVLSDGSGGAYIVPFPYGVSSANSYPLSIWGYNIKANMMFNGNSPSSRFMNQIKFNGSPVSHSNLGINTNTTIIYPYLPLNTHTDIINVANILGSIDFPSPPSKLEISAILSPRGLRFESWQTVEPPTPPVPSINILSNIITLTSPHGIMALVIAYYN